MSDYIPGSWFAAIAPQGAVVLPAAAGPERARNAWVALQAGGGLASVLETLTGAFGTRRAQPGRTMLFRERLQQLRHIRRSRSLASHQPLGRLSPGEVLHCLQLSHLHQGLGTL